MKRLLFLLLLIAGIMTGCGSTRKADGPGQKVQVTSEDSLEYELIIFDPGYETFLATQPQAQFYSHSYYESWNHRYVTEWNIRHRQPLRYGDFYQTEIHYDPLTDYGLDLNYRLYNYFLFIEKQYGIRLIHRARR